MRAAWVALAVAVGAKAVVVPDRHSVWPVFAAAGRHWTDGQSLYAAYPGLDRYRYSPPFAAAVAPLAALPTWAGGCLWGLLGVGTLYGGLRSLARHGLPAVPGAGGRSAFLGLAAVGAGPLCWNLQSNALVLGLAGYGAAAVGRRRWGLAAVLLAAPVYVKVWPAAFALLLAACWPARLAPRLVVATGVLTAVPLLTATPAAVAETYREWAASLADTQHSRWPGYRDLATIWELSGRPLDPSAHMLARLVGAVAATHLTLVAYRRNGPRAAVAMALGGWLCWQLLVGPGSERNTYGLLTIVAGWWAVAAGRAGPGRVWLTATLGALVLFSWGGAERLVPGGKAALPLAAASFAVWLGRHGLTVTAPVEQPVVQAYSVPGFGRFTRAAAFVRSG